ncbi:MAG: hypothetical protein FD163_922 [Hyphomonadaceae bacterium]|nr:MAG: hypothetical protein FD163_922 [Hyphomonadaceae bacterium]
MVGKAKQTALKLKPAIFALVFALFGFAVSPAFADNWIKAETDHFIVYSNNRANLTEEYSKNLEQFRYVLSAFHMNAAQRAIPVPKFEIYLVSRQRDLKEVWPEASEVSGFVTQCTNGLFAYSLYSGPTQGDQMSSLNVLFHEYAHIFMFQNSRVAYPRWYIEGFAEFYGSTKIRGDQVVIGTVPRSRYLTLAQSNFRIKYEDMLIDGEAVQRGNDEEDNFYAQSTILTHYLMSDPERRAALAAYISARNQGEDPLVAFERTIGIKASELSATMNRYMNGNISATLYRLRNMPTPTPVITPLPASADKLMLWDASAKGCADAEYRPALLAKIRTEAAKFPQDAFANAVLARAEIVIGEEEKALPFYTNLIATEPNNSEAHFRLGQTLYLMATHDKLAANETNNSQIAKARNAFLRAYQLDPLNFVNLYYLSKTATRNANFPDESSLNAALEAYLLAPSNRTYAHNAAILAIYADLLTEARDILQTIANNPHGGRLEQKYRDAISAINAGKTKSEVLRIISTPRPSSQAK